MLKGEKNNLRTSKNKDNYKYSNDDYLDYSFVDKKCKKNAFPILILLIIFLLCSICVLYKRNCKVIVKKETKIVMDENIVFLGDSLTDYYDLKKYYSKYYVVNSGISGNVTSDILGDMEKRVYIYNPSKVIIQIGTNDIQRKISDDDTIDNIKKIIENIQKNRPYAEIYVESLYPINKTDNDKIDKNMVGIRTNKVIKEYNEKIKKYCEDNKIYYIDMYAVLKDADDNLKLEYTKEGLHLSDEGYDVVTDEIKKTLFNNK